MQIDVRVCFKGACRAMEGLVFVGCMGSILGT